MKTKLKLTTRRIAASIAIAAAVATSATTAFADTTATYATGDTSLADGKVLFEYDESNNITKLTMTPGADEKLILTGDVLPFAAGAKIAFPASGGGTNVIANSFTTAGALEFAGPTNMTWGGGDYLPMDTYVTLFENVRLDDIVPIAGYGRTGNNTPIQSEEFEYTPFFIDRDEDSGTMRFELRNSIRDRCVFVEFAQDGDNIKGRVLESCLVADLDDETRAFTYNNDGSITFTSKATNTGNKRYTYQQQKWLTVGPRYGNAKLTFAMSEDRSLPAISGSGVDVTFDANAFGESALAFTSGTLMCNANWMTLTTEYLLSDIKLRTGNINGSYINKASYPDGLAAIVVGWECDGTSASCQFQGMDGAVMRCVDVELRQIANEVQIKWVQAFNAGDAGDYGKQKALIENASNTKPNNTARQTVNWASTVAPAATVNATGANTMVGAFIVKGDDAHPIVYDVAAKYAMPETIDCYGNATLNFSAKGGYNDGVSRYTDTITMHPGTTVTTSGDYPFHYNSGDVVLDGATLSYTTGTTYFNYVTFANGATVDKTGGTINAGYQGSNPKWTVFGTGLSTYTGDLSLLAHSSGANGTAKDLTIEVSDTVEGEGTDFLLTGYISVSTDRPNATIIKTGAGTMEVDGTIYTTNRAVRVTEGTLLLSKSGATAAAVDFSLQGGTLALADGTANTVNAVTLTDDSSISVGAGASLTMASLSIPEEKTLNITGEGKVYVTADPGAEVVSRILLNGKHVVRGVDGKLSYPGLMIIFR